MRYVEPDESKTIEKDSVVKKGTFSTNHKWARHSQSIARTTPKSEMSGWFSKNIVVSPNEIAAIVQDGKVVEVVESGKVRVGGLFKTDGYFKDVDVVIMDTSPKDSNWQVGELWTNDQHDVAAKGLLRYRVADAKKFFSMVYAYSSFDDKGERFLSLEDINDKIKSEVLTRVLQPETNSMEIEGIYGNRDFQKKVEDELELQLKSTLDMWGLELLKFTSEWDLGDYTGLVRVRRGFEKDEELKELDTLSKEGDHKRVGRVGVADVRSQHAVKSEVIEFGRRQKVKDAETEIEIAQKESKSDIEEAKRVIEEVYKPWKQAKAEARKAEVGIDQEVADKEHARELERLRLITEKGGADAARVIAEGREYSRLSPEHIEAIAKARESEARAKEDKISFMKEVEDRERGDAYRRQELDAKLMDAAKPVASGASVKKCSHCGATVPMQASFCGECGTRL
jgi:ribosomal protein L40E